MECISANLTIIRMKKNIEISHEFEVAGIASEDFVINYF
jgi:hypothetical protein